MCGVPGWKLTAGTDPLIRSFSAVASTFRQWKLWEIDGWMEDKSLAPGGTEQRSWLVEKK